jgi:hypothetical protein
MTRTIEQRLRLALTVIGAVVSAAKIGADWRKHGAHAEHSQACGCMVNCTRCIADGLLGR